MFFLKIVRLSSSTAYYLLVLENIDSYIHEIAILFKVNFRQSLKFYIIKNNLPYEILLDPPIIVFGHQHTFTIWAPPHFADIVWCHLLPIKKFICSSATSWWNSLPNFIFDTPLSSLVIFSRKFYNRFYP